ncbi:MAG: 2-oxoglutarate dehydrogenase E1 component, partial [Planctomycetota bacterium]
LVLWEAQFGDFANGAQIPIDQFVSSGEAKWRQLAGVVMLLPHGYDGQGPEHSSARLERFLQACSGGNMTVANCTTTAQIFHLMRRQGRSGTKRPLVVMTPKSFLRDKRAASPIEDLATGGFREVLVDDTVDANDVTRLVLCSGKLGHELETARAEKEIGNVAIARVEQLYPFPKDTILAEIERFPNLEEIVWSQEEPRNMGAWAFIMQRFHDLGRPIRYCGRAESASPATGSYSRHNAEQDFVLRMSLGEVEPATSLEG